MKNRRETLKKKLEKELEAVRKRIECLDNALAKDNPKKTSLLRNYTGAIAAQTAYVDILSWLEEEEESIERESKPVKPLNVNEICRKKEAAEEKRAMYIKKIYNAYLELGAFVKDYGVAKEDTIRLCENIKNYTECLYLLEGVIRCMEGQLEDNQS